MGFGPFFTLFFGSKKSYLSTSAKERDRTGDHRKLMENVRCASECFVALISKEGKNLSFYYAHSERTFE